MFTSDNSEMFMGVDMKKWGDDRIFYLLLKNNITERTSLSFIKKFLKSYNGNKNHVIIDKSLGIDITKLRETNKSLFDLLIENEHYKKKIEIKYTPDILMNGFIEYKSQPTKIFTLAQILEKYNGRSIETYYITLSGLIHMIEIFPDKYQTENMKDIFKKIILWSAIISEDKDMDNIPDM